MRKKQAPLMVLDTTSAYSTVLHVSPGAGKWEGTAHLQLGSRHCAHHESIQLSKADMRRLARFFTKAAAK